jgi:DNA-binding response OmpR family regulator
MLSDRISHKSTYLVVDDDAKYVEFLTEHLTDQKDVAALIVNNGSDAIRLTKERIFGIILLNSNLSDSDGHQVCRTMRNNGVVSPIIFLSEQMVDSDEILALESGASDYVKKSVNVEVLNARIRAHLRKHIENESAILPIGSFWFHPSDRILLDESNDRIVRLTEKETAILKFLYQAKGYAVSRNDILREIWNYNISSTTNTLTTHIYRLRKKIEPDPSKARILVRRQNAYQLFP